MAELYEYYITGDDGSAPFHSSYWDAQTFTPSEAHKITSVKLKLLRENLPGIVTVSIRATLDGHPTGGDLCSGTTNGNTLTTNTDGEWREITLGAGYNLEADEMYAIVVRVPDVEYPDCLRWRYDLAGSTYAGGCVEESNDSGLSWNSYTDRDFMFEDWGELPAVEYEKTLTESLGLVDKVVKAPSVVKTEPLGLLDTYSKTWAIYRVYPEILGLSDTVIATRLLVKVLTELLGLSDTVKKDTSKMLAENLGLVDVYSRTWSVYRTYDELLGLADSIRKDIALHPLVEPLGLLDTVVKSPSITRDELLGLKDSIQKDMLLHPLTESLGLVDTVAKTADKRLTETLGLIDTYSRIRSIQRTYTEALGLEDRVSKHVSLHALTEVLGLLDSISYGKNLTVMAKLIRKLIQLEDVGGGGES